MDRKKCFVISPIGAEGSEIRHQADDVFEFIIKPAMEHFNIEAIRSDHMSETGRITEQMFREILTADLCIADLTGLNPNVLYELAVAQSASRPVIVIMEVGGQLPFDIRDIRCIEYSRQSIQRFVSGLYVERVKAQIQAIQDSEWSAPSIYETYHCAPRFQHEFQLYRFLRMASPPSLEPGQDARYTLAEGSKQHVVVLTGEIGKIVQNRKFRPHVIVNMEGMNLQLARYYQPSVSGVLRYLDAERNAGGQVTTDSMQVTINEYLQHKDIRPPLNGGMVVPTKTTGLKKNYGVDYVFHVAAHCTGQKINLLKKMA